MPIPFNSIEFISSFFDETPGAEARRRRAAIRLAAQEAAEPPQEPIFGTGPVMPVKHVIIDGSGAPFTHFYKLPD